MNHKILFFSVFIFIIFQRIVYSQTSYINDNFTYHNGDYWVYELYMHNDVLIDIETKKVIKDTILANQIAYKKIQKKNLFVSPYSYYSYERVDSNENIFYYSFDNTIPLNQKDQLFLKLNVEVGDTFTTDLGGNDGYWLVEDIWYDSFGKNILFHWNSLILTYLYFNQVVGLYWECYEGGETRLLRGAYIDGILIGDTSTTKSKIFDEQIPKESLILKNYPNPFNNFTIINYSVEFDSYVLLKLININGKLIRNLENSFKRRGNYNICWNGLNDNGKPVPSGIYYCRLMTQQGSKVKKMLLLK